jgi:hypothetical protein
MLRVIVSFPHAPQCTVAIRAGHVIAGSIAANVLKWYENGPKLSDAIETT